MIRINQSKHSRSNTMHQIAFILTILASLSNCQLRYNIGGIFSSVDSELMFKNAVEVANIYPESHGLGSVRFNYSTTLLKQDPIATMKLICDNLINNTVYVVVTDRLINNTRPPFIVSYACAFYNIPVIGVASRESQFSDKVFRFL